MDQLQVGVRMHELRSGSNAFLEFGGNIMHLHLAYRPQSGVLFCCQRQLILANDRDFGDDSG